MASIKAIGTHSGDATRSLRKPERNKIISRTRDHRIASCPRLRRSDVVCMMRVLRRTPSHALVLIHECVRDAKDFYSKGLPHESATCWVQQPSHAVQFFRSRMSSLLLDKVPPLHERIHRNGIETSYFWPVSVQLFV